MGKAIENAVQFTGQEAKRFLLERMQAVEPMPPDEAAFLGSEASELGDQNFDEKQITVVSKWGRLLGVAFAVDVRNANDFRSVRSQYRAAVASLMPIDVLFHVAHQTRFNEENERRREQRNSRNRFFLVTALVLLIAILFVLAVTSGKLGLIK
jgi:hypothetical protein